MPEMFPDWASLLNAGVTDHASAWRNITLATAGPNGAPQARTLVLRRFAGREVDVHTDARSTKFAELKANPAAALHGWDPASRIQLRACGTVMLHVANAVADQAWTNLSDSSRDTYRIGLAPGTQIATPDTPNPRVSDAEARSIFCVIRLTIHTVEWLHLAQGSHRRARFTWAEGAPTAMWLVP